MVMLARRCSEGAASSPGCHCMLDHHPVQLTSLQMRLSFLGLILRFCCLHRPASSLVPRLTRCFCSSSATGMSGTAISGDMDSGSFELEDVAVLVCRVRNACSIDQSQGISYGAQVTYAAVGIVGRQGPPRERSQVLIVAESLCLHGNERELKFESVLHSATCTWIGAYL